MAEKKSTTTYPVPVVYRVGRQTVRLGFQEVKDLICRGQPHKPSDQEVVAFMMYCKARRADPWVQDSMIIKYAQNQPAAFVDGVGFYLRIAEENPKYRGYKSGIIVRRKRDPEKTREAVKFAVQQLGQTVESRDVVDLLTKEYEIVEKEGTFLDDGEQLIGAWCQVYREDRDHLPKWTVNFNEYDQKQAVWKEKPATMIHKVGISQAHRYCFKQLRGGMSREEYEMLGGIGEVEELPVDGVQRLRDKALECFGDESAGYATYHDFQTVLEKYFDDLSVAMNTPLSNIYELVIEKCATKEGMKAFLKSLEAHVKDKIEGGPTEEETGEKTQEEESGSGQVSDDTEGAPPIVEEWSILLGEAELSDAWQGYKRFAGLDTHEKVYEVVERAQKLGFQEVIKKLGDWWVMIPKVNQEGLIKGKDVQLNESIVKIGMGIFK